MFIPFIPWQPKREEPRRYDHSSSPFYTPSYDYERSEKAYGLMEPLRRRLLRDGYDQVVIELADDGRVRYRVKRNGLYYQDSVEPLCFDYDRDPRFFQAQLDGIAEEVQRAYEEGVID